MNSDFFNNLSSYSEYVLKCAIVGSPLNDPEILKNLHKVEDYYWFVADGHFCFIDKNGNEVKNVIIKNDFRCHNCTSLTSLEGAPQEVGVDFVCSGCTSLTSLKGAPKEVGGDFICSGCTSLTSLKGAPKKVGRDFICSSSISLTVLKGAPKEVSRDFVCSDCTSLTSLKGAPQKVGRDFYFYCNDSKSLTSFE